ncbi:MAG: tetratricopeptide repeat protein [bacterium]
MKPITTFILVFIFSIILLSASVSSNSITAFELASTAQAYYDDQEYEPAITAAKQALSDPGIPKSARDQALNVLGWSYFHRKDYQRAITEFKNIMDNYPDCRYHGSAMMMLAQCYQTTGNIVAAMQTYTKVLSLYPDPNEYRTITAKKELAALYLSIQTTTTGLFKTISTNTSLMAVIPDSLFAAGQIQIDKQQDYIAATRYFREITDHFPDYNQTDIILWKLGICLKEQHQYYDAITVYRQVIEKFPTSKYRYHAEYGMFDATQNIGTPEETIEAAKKLLNSPVRDYRKTGVQVISGLYASLGDSKGALKFLKEQQEKDPKCLTNEEYQEQMKTISAMARIPYSAPSTSNTSAEIESILTTKNNIDDVYLKISDMEIFRKLQYEHQYNYQNLNPIVINEALSLLTTSANSIVRKQIAMHCILFSSNTTMIHGLVIALNTEKDIDVKMTIAGILGDMGVVEAIPGILQCIQTFSQQTGYYMDCLNYRGSIIQSLGKCGPAAIDSILILSNDERVWRRYASDLIKALGNTKDKRTLTVLAQNMHNPDSELRLTAAFAAMPLASDSTDIRELIFTTLVTLTSDSSSYVREHAANLLGIFGVKFYQTLT